MGGWLTTSAGGRSPDEIQEKAENAVADSASRMQDPLLPSAVDIFNDTLSRSGLADEYLHATERFVKLFRHEEIFVSSGETSNLDFVRECVRRSFGVSQIVPQGPEGQKRRWVTDEQIEKIAVGLVELGYVLPPKA
jgi:hypothetical protein